ncbi:precorrin-2 C(20)-methyltransferase [Carboxylicivirga sp. A043]|uniref:precorrin-2 C(20)-methyltransferase n=1 Tax=Carboxylicivirga litoralis TaxID=2816963 RepID=UPI0021CAE70C|nr:precorrin-2 C(20)-methyltransferase [Carboxylicivirga sp. A043]MCU4155662.1 precorrin-2 C(20)-methyltransferase [Carboxylicivirga sp. A043]
MIYGVALGPGDPELITIKALRILQQADIIYYPSTINSEGTINSMAYRVLGSLEIDQSRLKSFEVPMKYDRTDVSGIYQRLAQESILKSREGQQVAIVSEGDISFYSTFAYLIDDFKKANVSFEMIPGVPAFILGGSLSQQAICMQNDNVLITPAIDGEAHLTDLLLANETVVIMKVSKIKDWIIPFINTGNYAFFYGEYMGTDKEYTCTAIAELLGRSIPYFSILIIKSANNHS